MTECFRYVVLSALAVTLLFSCRFETPLSEHYARDMGTSVATTDAMLAWGADLFSTLGCVGCHRFDGYPRETGIDLTDIGQRDVNLDHRVDLGDAHWINEHFLSPSTLRPGSFMPNFDMSDEDAAALTLLMLEFRDGEIPDGVSKAFAPIADSLGGVARGERLFEYHGCGGCHGPQGGGGTRGPNIGGIAGLNNFAEAIVSEKAYADKIIAMSERGESISTSAERWLGPFNAMKRVIVSGRIPASKNGKPALLVMPAHGSVLNSRDLDALGAYILSLFPEDNWESWD